MGKTIGAVDKIRGNRKRRSDYGSKRKLFMGHPPKGKREIRFERKIGNRNCLKLWVWEIKDMPYDSYLRFNRYIRAKIHKKIYIPTLRIDAQLDEINTKEKIEDMMAYNFWQGEFLIMGFSNAKNRFHTKPVKICRVVIKENDDGNRARIVQSYRLHRYKWFYKG